MAQTGQGLWALVLMFVLAIILGLSLVWVNIERVDSAYALKSLERTYQDKQDQHSKLLIERQYLLAPATLRERAEKAGLHSPRREQIRMIE
ncbi:MAG: hypothetical protein GX055_02950 [Desulfovibrionales bacterium]|nr:hypothetical protein [Desulfovibrionales bacterium]